MVFKHKDPGGELTQAEFVAACGDGHIFASQATGDILYASSATVLSKLARGAANTVLSMGGSCIPAWTATPSLTSITVSGAASSTITSTNNATCAIYLRANGGTSETIKIHSDQGTSVTEGAASIELLSDAGGVELRSTANLANAINLTSDGGTTSTIQIFNDQGTAVNEGVASIQLLSDVGGIGIKSGLNAAGAIRLTADAGTSETISLHADQGNTTASICLTSDAGGITLNPATFVTVGGNATNAGEIRILEDTDHGSNYVAITAGNVTGSYTITLPTAVAGGNCYVLTSTTGGVTSWAAASTGAVTRAGGQASPNTTNNTSSAGSTIQVTSGICIATTTPFTGKVLTRKTSANCQAGDAGGGVTLNCIVLAAPVHTGAIGQRLAGVFCDGSTDRSGHAEFYVPATVANHAAAGATGVSTFGGTSYVTYAGTGDRPACVAVTAVKLTGLTEHSDVSIGHDELHIYSWASS